MVAIVASEGDQVSSSVVWTAKVKANVKEGNTELQRIQIPTRFLCGTKIRLIKVRFCPPYEKNLRRLFLPFIVIMLLSLPQGDDVSDIRWYKVPFPDGA